MNPHDPLDLGSSLIMPRRWKGYARVDPDGWIVEPEPGGDNRVGRAFVALIVAVGAIGLVVGIWKVLGL